MLKFRDATIKSRDAPYSETAWKNKKKTTIAEIAFIFCVT